MMNEEDLRHALDAANTPRLRLSTTDIVRRGHRRAVLARSATTASAVGVVAVVGVTGVALSGGSTQSTTTGQAGSAPAPVSTASIAASPGTAALPITANSNRPRPASEPSAVPTSAPGVVTTIPFGSGTVGYSLRAERLFGDGNGVMLDLAGSDGTLSIAVDGGVPAHTTKAAWWSGDDPFMPTSWLVYGVVPAGATHLEVYIGDKAQPTTLTSVPGASSLVFAVLGNNPAPTADGPVSKVAYLDAAGNRVTATAATSQVTG